eukprot:COSAG04_NODE_11428_length_709_cov_1.283607_1_plen_37_part_10
MDWKTGEVNAKYYAIQMLARLGAGERKKRLLRFLFAF